MALTKKQAAAAAKIIRDQIAADRAAEVKLSKEHGLNSYDPYADTRVEEEDGSVTVTYDGAGYDSLTYHNEGNSPMRDRIREELEAIGLYYEDVNNWSFAVYPI